MIFTERSEYLSSNFMFIFTRAIDDGFLTGIIVVCAGDLGEPVLLSVRIPLPRLHHPHHLLLSNLDRHGLLSVVWRGQFHVYNYFNNLW